MSHPIQPDRPLCPNIFPSPVPGPCPCEWPCKIAAENEAKLPVIRDFLATAAHHVTLPRSRRPDAD